MLTPIEKAAATRLGNSILRRKLPEHFEDMTCARLFATTWQPENLVEKLWAPIVLATINASVEEASAVLFVNVVREAFFASRTSSALLIPKVGLSELLIDPAIRKLQEGGIEIYVWEAPMFAERNAYGGLGPARRSGVTWRGEFRGGKLISGETIQITMRATPGGKGFFRIQGVVGERKMQETSAGVYEGTWRAPAGRNFRVNRADILAFVVVGERATAEKTP